MHDVLGHERCGVVGGDVGGVVAVDLLHRYPGFVEKLVFFDTVPPWCSTTSSPRGIDPAAVLSDGPTGDYRQRQGGRPRTHWPPNWTPCQAPPLCGEMYGHRLWASPGTFGPADVDFMTEPFGTEERLRAGWAVYQLAYGRPVSEPPIMDRKVDVPTLILYGMDDHVVGPEFLHTCEVAFTNRTGPSCCPVPGISCSGSVLTCSMPWSSRFRGSARRAAGPAERPCPLSANRRVPPLSASTLMYRVLGGRRTTLCRHPRRRREGTDECRTPG